MTLFRIMPTVDVRFSQRRKPALPFTRLRWSGSPSADASVYRPCPCPGALYPRTSDNLKFESRDRPHNSTNQHTSHILPVLFLLVSILGPVLRWPGFLRLSACPCVCLLYSVPECLLLITLADPLTPPLWGGVRGWETGYRCVPQ